MKKRLILGGPGAGKTHYLMDQVEQYLEAGVGPDQIAFVSFTQKAANEARDRAALRFGLDPESLPYFRTIHSLCYRAIGCSHGDVIAYPDRKRFADWIGEPMEFKNPLDDEWDGYGAGITDGDRMMFLVGYAAAKQITVREAWAAVNVGADISWERVDRFARGWEFFKQRAHKIDFSDMLTTFCQNGRPLADVKVAVIDEAQDLSTAQWAVMDLAFSEADVMLVAGDDDQAVHAWAGADTRRFLGLQSFERHVLPKSHRLPSKIFDYAAQLVGGIRHRYAKQWGPRSEGGSVVRGIEVDQVPFNADDGTWYLLARNNVFLRELEATCYRAGLIFNTRHGSSVRPHDVVAIDGFTRLQAGGTVNLDEAKQVVSALRIRRVLHEKREYGLAELTQDKPELASKPWHWVMYGIPEGKRNYYEAIQRAGKSLHDKPNVTIGTIHSVKGGEADHVMCMSDCTRLTSENAETDDELRVAYVGATRAKRTLWIAQPTGLWQMPF